MHPGTLQIKWLLSVPLLLTDVHGSLRGLVCACLSLERSRVTHIAVNFGMNSFSAHAILAEIIRQVTSWQKRVIGPEEKTDQELLERPLALSHGAGLQDKLGCTTFRHRELHTSRFGSLPKEFPITVRKWEPR
jgi:hypothetical protein